MKQTKQTRKSLSLNKTTIAMLPKAQMHEIKAGNAQGTVLLTIRDQPSIPESCGYACGDCMSVVTRLTISFQL